MSDDYKALSINKPARQCEYYKVSPLFGIYNGRGFIQDSGSEIFTEITRYGDFVNVPITETKKIKDSWEWVYNQLPLFYFNAVIDTWYDLAAYIINRPNTLSCWIKDNTLLIKVRHNACTDYITIKIGSFVYTYEYYFGDDIIKITHMITKNGFNLLRANGVLPAQTIRHMPYGSYIRDLFHGSMQIYSCLNGKIAVEHIKIICSKKYKIDTSRKMMDIIIVCH